MCSAVSPTMLKVTVTAHRPGPSQQPGHRPAAAQALGGGPYDGSWSKLNAYIPILVLGAIGTAFAVGSVVLASLVGPSRYNRSKLAAYECGIEPTHTSDSGSPPAPGQRFPVKYYLTAMLFIVFDIEIVFLYPWAVTFDVLGKFALVEMVVFMLTVFVAYAYVWRRGGLTWD
jgi:NADH-quinone oxidoreductase subunit A